MLATYAALLDDVRRVRWPAVRRVRSGAPGVHASKRRGTTTEFIEYRLYRQGDDPRRLDWKLLARSDRPFIRISQERAVLPTIVVVDASASMAFPEPSLAKWELARHLGVALGAVVRNGGDPAGMTVARAGDRLLLTPRTRQSIVGEMIALLDVAPGGAAPLVDAVREATRRCTRLVVISDFLGDGEAVITPMSHFVAAGYEAHAIHVVAEEELNPGRKQLLVTDPEAPAVRRPLPPAIRAEYQRRFAAWREELARRCRSAGVSYTMAVTGDEPAGHIVRRIVAGPVAAGVS